MILELNEEQKILQKNARDFMEREIIPIADEYDRKYHPLPKDIALGLLKKLVPLGYVGSTLSPEYGGQNLDPISYAVLGEELARAYLSLGMIVLIQDGSVLPILVEHGTPEQKAKYIPKIMSLEKITCFCLTEPDVGSGARDLKTAAVLDGDHYILNGTKTWITSGGIADLAVVFTSTDKGKGARGISCLLVDNAESPFATRELPKLGCRSCPTSELNFEDCRVPKDNLIGTPGSAYLLALGELCKLRVAVGIGALGLAQAAIDAAVKYARERKQFGRPIGSFQLIQEMIADMAILTDAARFLCYRALYLIGKGQIPFKEASMAKAYSTEMAVEVTSKAIQVHGAYGISEEYPVERYFRDARTLTFPDGATQIQKLVIGREMLGISAFV
ncbi:MAG: acyl-CoA dehydrogenase [Chloroflexi bacterium]|nr:acyl-CoA dehydrogenase [Chloroflexota bacterium]